MEISFKYLQAGKKVRYVSSGENRLSAHLPLETTGLVLYSAVCGSTHALHNEPVI